MCAQKINLHIYYVQSFKRMIFLSLALSIFMQKLKTLTDVWENQKT